jgi:hypothetical protein
MVLPYQSFSAISIAGASRDQYEAAIMTPPAKPTRGEVIDAAGGGGLTEAVVDTLAVGRADIASRKGGTWPGQNCKKG